MKVVVSFFVFSKHLAELIADHEFELYGAAMKYFQLKKSMLSIDILNQHDTSHTSGGKTAFEND